MGSSTNGGGEYVLLTCVLTNSGTATLLTSFGGGSLSNTVSN